MLSKVLIGHFQLKEIQHDGFEEQQFSYIETQQNRNTSFNG